MTKKNIPHLKKTKGTCNHILHLISTFEMYDKEEKGIKPNTIRIFKSRDNAIVSYNRIKNKTYIKERRGYTKKNFMRKITDISLWENIIIISWRHNNAR